MKLQRYLALARYVYARKIQAHLPWYQWRLRKKYARFVTNYSDEGDAKLVLHPCVGDNVAVVQIGDREYEYAYVVKKFQEYAIKGKNVLDVGSAGSVIPTILASLDNNVTCVDVREWPIKWPNLKFVKGDLLESDGLFPRQSFDVITCISTVEHFGLGRYGDTEDPEGDIKDLAKLKGCLKPGGLMVLTTPFGRPTVAFPAHRIYNKSRFMKLVSGFKILDMAFFGPIDDPGVFRPCSEEETYSLDTRRSYAIVCSLLQKKEEA